MTVELCEVEALLKSSSTRGGSGGGAWGGDGVGVVGAGVVGAGVVGAGVVGAGVVGAGVGADPMVKVLVSIWPKSPPMLMLTDPATMV